MAQVKGGKSKGKGKASLPTWECALCGAPENYGSRTECRYCYSLAPGKVLDRLRTFRQAKGGGKGAAPGGKGKGKAQQWSAWAQGPPAWLWNAGKPNAEKPKAEAKSPEGAREGGTGDSHESPPQHQHIQVLQKQYEESLALFGAEDAMVVAIKAKLDMASESPAPRSERTVARRKSKAVDKAAAKVDKLQKQFDDYEAEEKEARSKKEAVAPLLAQARQELQAAKADQARDEAAEDAEDEKEKKDHKESAPSYDVLMEIAHTLRDGNGNIDFEALFTELRERRDKRIAVERKRRRLQVPMVHHIGGDDSEDEEPITAEDAAMAPDEPGFSSAVEEGNEDTWEQVRGRMRKRPGALPAPPATPPGSGDEGRRSRSPRG